MDSSDGPLIDAATVARQLAASLRKRGQDYALGGAIALGYWATPRGTVDVDLTLFVAPENPSKCVWLLQEVGCQLEASRALSSLQEHGYCQVLLRNLRVDVFLPTLPFYETARKRCREVTLGGDPIKIWDAESLAVFKMMFFRRKDVADVEQIIRAGANDLDRRWVREQLVGIYGPRDPRIAQWDELDRELPT